MSVSEPDLMPPAPADNEATPGGDESYSTPILEIAGLHKTLAGNPVLRGIDLTVDAGEVHALMGGNGAGKSTLIKCLSGYWRPDDGEVRVLGEPLDTSSGQIAFVQQDLGLIPNLSVVENICVGRGFATNRLGRVQWRTETTRVAQLLDDLGHPDIDPTDELARLDSVERTVVAIARATQGLQEGAKLLVLDEPTTALPIDEADRLFETVDRLRRSGVGLIYVSHHLAEVFELADRISVLRDGELVGTGRAAELTDNEVVTMMLGRTIQEVRRTNPPNDETVPPTVEVKGLTGDRVTDVSFAIRPGEIVGLAGLQGSGCTEVAELLFGARQPVAGEIRLNGEPTTFSHPADAMSAGVALVTEDRHLNGSFVDRSVTENISVTDVGRFFVNGWLRRGAERRETDDLIARFDVQPAQRDRLFSTLSGGNQQKAVLAKWIRTDPALLICDQPDVGVDIGAKHDIYSAVIELVEAGSAALIISNQLDDLEALCNRVVVLRGGRIAAVLSGPEATEHEISRLVVGATNDSPATEDAEK